jgi:ribonucleoside-triphosphate reductase (thioredoxin)
MWEQLGLAAFLQRYWADNQVSCTVTFDPETEGPQLQNALNLYQYQLKGISFLPRKRSSSQEEASSTSTPQTVYPQMPYEMITEERYQREMSSIQPFNLQEFCLDKSLKPSVSEVPDKFCDSAGCIVQSETIKEL